MGRLILERLILSSSHPSALRLRNLEMSEASSIQIPEAAELGGGASGGESAGPRFVDELSISAGAFRATSWHARSAADLPLPHEAAAQPAMFPFDRAKPAQPGSSRTWSGHRDGARTNRCS